MKFHHSTAIAAALALCACGQAGTEGTLEMEPSSPDISPTAAPGVAFRYGYDFSLADARISHVQEGQAAQCEQLGIARCRITGLRYSVDEHERVSAMLQVKLDPAIARQFGKAAVAIVEQNGGRLVNAEFTGEDEVARIQQATSQRAELEARIAETERRLATMGAGDRERTALQQQLEDLRRQAAGTGTAIAASQERLASTPMTFSYYGKGALPGFRGANPFVEGWRAFLTSSVTLIRALLFVTGAILPWLALLLIAALLIRSRLGAGVRRWWQNTRYSEGDRQP